MSAHDETIIGELRRCRANLREPAPADRAAWTMKLTMEEVDALLRAVDERDELRRQTVGDLETGINPVRVETMSLGDHGIATVPERFQPARPITGAGFASAAALLREKRIAEGDRLHEVALEEVAFRGHDDTAKTHTITSCPHAGTHHSCPLGGCPTKEPRTISIPDLPAEDGIVTGASFATGAAALAATAHTGLVNAAKREDDLAREARETPPREYECCNHCSDPIRAGRAEKPHLHLIPCTACGQTA